MRLIRGGISRGTDSRVYGASFIDEQCALQELTTTGCFSTNGYSGTRQRYRSTTQIKLNQLLK